MCQAQAELAWPKACEVRGMYRQVPFQFQRFSALFSFLVAAATHRKWLFFHKARPKAVVYLLLWGSLLVTTTASAQDMRAAELIARTATGGEAALPVVEEHVTVQVDQGHASSTYLHAFQNESGEILEGRYAISLGTVATATGFSYFNGEKRIVGEIFEKQAAARVYETVTGSGRDPGLLEQTGEGTFSFRVAPIARGEKKRVTVTTSQWLTQTHNTLELQVPLRRSGESSRISIRDSRPLGRIWSPSHPIDVKRTPEGARLRVLASSTSGKRLILRYEVAQKDYSLSTAWHRDAGSDGYLMAQLVAPAGSTKNPSPRDVTLVVDRSGSMSGAPLAAAIAATRGVIEKLRDEDRVNVVAFDTEAESLFVAPQRVREVRKAALDHVDAIQLAGGTDLATALSEALARTGAADRAQVVLFLTDGQSSAEQALLAASKAPPNVRLFTVGIGSGVDRALLSRLAREHGGRFLFVADEANLERDVEQLYARIDDPLLSDLKFSVVGARLRRLYPQVVPDLFKKDQLTFLARVVLPNSATAPAPLSVQIEGKRNGKSFSTQTTVVPATMRRPWVGRMWAQKRVDYLLEEMSLRGETKELKEEALQLALAYDLVTRYTSFLAIPESEISDQVRGTIEQERERRRRILAKHEDAAKLSRSLMPPGDPVISLKAPASALGVTAVFPFGLSLDLKYDPAQELWQARFLVPHDVADGSYPVELFVVGRDGQLTHTTTSYEIDSRAPAFDVQTTNEPNAVRLQVVADETLREVRLAPLPTKPSLQLATPHAPCLATACTLTQTDERTFFLRLSLPAGIHRFRVVATDSARNESVQIVVLQVADKHPSTGGAS